MFLNFPVRPEASLTHNAKKNSCWQHSLRDPSKSVGSGLLSAEEIEARVPGGPPPWGIDYVPNMTKSTDHLIKL